MTNTKKIQQPVYKTWAVTLIETLAESESVKVEMKIRVQQIFQIFVALKFLWVQSEMILFAQIAEIIEIIKSAEVD